MDLFLPAVDKDVVVDGSEVLLLHILSTAALSLDVEVEDIMEADEAVNGPLRLLLVFKESALFIDLKDVEVVDIPTELVWFVEGLRGTLMGPVFIFNGGPSPEAVEEGSDVDVVLET